MIKLTRKILVAGIYLFSAGISYGVPGSEQGIVFYVSPDGNDAWSGKRAEPNRNKTEGPFSTIEKARDAIRSYKKARGPLPQPVTVYIRGGLYVLSKPLVFSPDDSGAQKGPVTYAAYPGENPMISAGRKITGWKELTIDVADVNPEAKGRVWVAEVPTHWRFNQLFINGTRLSRSASPNADQWEHWYKSVGGEGKTTLLVPPGTLHQGTNLEDEEINFLPLPGSRFVNFISPIKELDEKKGAVTLAGSAPYDIKKNDPFRIENALEGIDRPGEWSLDTKAGKVYLWPPNGFNPAKVEIIAPGLDAAIIMKGDEEKGEFVKFITLRGLTITYVDRTRLDQAPPPGGHGGPDTNNAAVLLQGVEDISIVGSRIANVGAIGIRGYLYAKRVNVLDNEISQCGGSGVSFEGYGPGLHYVNRDHQIARNHIHHCGQIYWHGAGISVGMAGDLTISDNHIHDMPYTGIFGGGIFTTYFHQFKRDRAGGFRWDEIGDDPLTTDSVKKFIPGHITIQNNVIRDVMQVLEDGGGIYLLASHHNVIRNNVVYRCAGAYSFGIYLDADELDTLIEKNVVYRCPGEEDENGAALLLNANGRNTVQNNIFALTNRPFRFAGSYGGHTVTHNIFLCNSKCKPGEDPARHASYGLGGLESSDYGMSVMDKNLYWSLGNGAVIRGFMEAWRQKGWDIHSVVADPQFVDAEHLNFHLRPESPALKMGFKPIDEVYALPRKPNR